MTSSRAIELIEALRASEDKRAAAAIIRAFESTATPADFVAAAAGNSGLPEETANALTASIGVAIRADEAEPYQRISIAPAIDLYSDVATPPSAKTLIVAFAGAAGRMMLPIATFLQALPASRYDCVLLRDLGKLHYQIGIEGYADTLAGVVARLKQDIRPETYRSLVTIGSSMGGFPALRAGALFPADRAISIGGRRMWHVRRMTRTEDYPAALAFEPLCVCGPAAPQLVCVFAKDSPLDRRSAEMIAALRPVTFVEPDLSDRHNVLFAQWQAGTLEPFLNGLINADPIEGSIEQTSALGAPI